MQAPQSMRATRLNVPAHRLFTGRVTATLIRQHGSYERARRVLDGEVES